MASDKAVLVPLKDRERALFVFCLALWFGLVTSLAQGLIYLVRVHVFGTIFVGRMDPNHLWKRIAIHLLIFLSPGLLFFVVSWKWPRVLPLRVAGVALAFLACYSFRVTYFQEVPSYAWYVLVFGILAATARILGFDPRRLRRFVGRTLVIAAALAVIWSLMIPVRRTVAEHRAEASLKTPLPGSPNVLFIVLDTVRAQNLSLYGYHRATTPQLERLARSGTCFEHAVAPTSWTLPSHAVMFTGRYPHELSTGFLSPLDSTYPTLAEYLGQRGYRTAGFVANQNFCDRAFGLARGFIHYEDYFVSWEGLVDSSEFSQSIAQRLWRRPYASPKKGAATVNREFLTWLDRKDRQPFFAFLNYMDAHDPYLPPAPYASRFSTVGGGSSPRTSSQEDLDAYDACIASLDDQIGRLLDNLRERGLLENTLVIITSDHGEQFGEHGLHKHGNSLYRPVLHVPLLLVFPGHVPAGKRIREPASLRDMAATVTDLLGASEGSPFPGESLTRYWANDDLPARFVEKPLLSELNLGKNDSNSVVFGGYHYIRFADDREELYDWLNDVSSEHNLAPLAAHRDALQRCRTALEHVLAPGGVGQ